MEGVKRWPVGAHGYCMSGPYALAAAARYPDRIAAAASFYGTWLVSDAVESPHLTLGKGKGERYIACAEIDELAPLPMVAQLRGLFDKAGSPGELEIYPGRAPWFRLPAAQDLRQAGGRAALGAPDRPLPPQARLSASVSCPRLRARLRGEPATAGAATVLVLAAASASPETRMALLRQTCLSWGDRITRARRASPKPGWMRRRVERRR